MRDYWDDYGEPENRKAFVTRELARLNLTPAPEDPAVTERKAREAKHRLEQHDKLFGITRGCTLEGYQVNRPGFTAGDGGMRDD